VRYSTWAATFAAVRRLLQDELRRLWRHHDLARHYGTAIFPARVRKPRDKAKVETAVQIVEREILAPLRHEVFTALAELQHALAFGNARVNGRPFQRLAGSVSEDRVRGRD
jgi:transposase